MSAALDLRLAVIERIDGQDAIAEGQQSVRLLKGVSAPSVRKQNGRGLRFTANSSTTGTVRARPASNARTLL